jgi:peptide subunit release factor 1 (eRF1)
LAIYIGSIIDAAGKGEKRLNIDFEPPKPLGTFVYKFDSKFDVS